MVCSTPYVKKIMRLKQAVAIFGTLIFVAVVFIAYSAKYLSAYPNRESPISQELQDNKWLRFEDKIKELENNLNEHQYAVHEIKMAVKNILRPNSVNISQNNLPSFRLSRTQDIVDNMIYETSCPFEIDAAGRSDVQMLDLYGKLSFDNIDGGVWKQGWKIDVDEKDWNRQNKLKVFVVPHSHNDPGWIKTLDEYYVTQTKHILDNMLTKLSEDARRKFIWAEISYFSMWWEEQDEEDRLKVKNLLRNNQLEIVTGGWVMNDEANSHWISIMNQLTDGHQWLRENLNYTPVSHWSIDPFGLSLTQPFLLREMGLNNMLIQRVHYSVKKHLAREQQLEFRWSQLWDGKGQTEMFTHMMPFYSYDIPHTCGPDPKVCCQFDFKRLPNYGLHCPWRIAPQVITERNVVERAELLLDQYRKKSKLYKTNVLLVPLGDDFRYDHPSEWDVQYENYQRLFDHMNSNLHLNVQINFGTLTDYFNELHKSKTLSSFPTLTGDFFTYADRDDHYWSGYYTSRPFYKRMDRILLSYIRAAESIHTLAHLSKFPGHSWIVEKSNGIVKAITSARQSLSLFQHHDGITGTAKDHVVIDYGKRMLSSIQACQKVIQLCSQILLKGPSVEKPTNSVFYHVDDVRHSQNVVSEHFQITIGVPEVRSKKVVIYNSLTFTRREAVTFHISTPYIEVIDFEGKRVHCQISPIFEYSSSMSQSKYQLTFVSVIPALSLRVYTINALLESVVPSETVFSKVKILNYFGQVRAPAGFNVNAQPSPAEFTLQNARVTASFNKFGLLKALKIGKTTIPIHLEFAKYGVQKRSRSETSGAYLFLPDGDAVKIPLENVVVNIIEGPIMSSVLVQLPYVQHTAILFNTTGADGLGIEFQNLVDISQMKNFELIMRLSSNINSSNEFFTDVNGFQIMKRRKLKKLPLQANYYPIPTMAYIEDQVTRLTVTTSSPLGCSSLNSGQLEIMLDRRLNQDDNLGLGQGVMDNLPTKHVFRLILERRKEDCQQTNGRNNPAGFPTLAAHVASQSLLNPTVQLLRVDDDEEISLNSFSLTRDFGVDVSMPVFSSNLRANKDSPIGLVLRREFLNTCYGDRRLFEEFPLSDGTVNLHSLVGGDKALRRSSLSFGSVKSEEGVDKMLRLCPMDVQAFVF
ncbi:unnamed protein product [Phyllotreta striolata]|uniref:Alpha-mannosidase n=1 Tax=Phyllotreta striolata TaxID=444603 RepID=A0A9N9XK70_PHYSR|nr:unnamed protein product [Phyllotreta striolata]